MEKDEIFFVLITIVFGTLIGVLFTAIFNISDQGDENAIDIARLFVCVNNKISPCE